MNFVMMGKGVRAVRGYLPPYPQPLEQKTENCFSPVSFDCFIRIITEV